MSFKTLLYQFPQRLRVSLEARESWYERVNECFSVHGPTNEFVRSHALLLFESEGIAVLPGDPDATYDLLEGLSLGPVYRLGSAGSFSVPTGRVFIRFGMDTDLKSHELELRRAGYEIFRTLGRTPYAGWVRAVDNSLLHGLAHIENLEKLSGVENVAPEMLSEKANR